MAKHFSRVDDPELVSLIRQGAVGIIPTDTVYGLVAQASNDQAVRKLYATKSRELPPGTMIGATIESFADLGFDHAQLTQVARYWPAGLSVVLDATNIPAYLKQNREALPVRIPNAANLTSLLSQTGPLMTTSANAPKQPTSTSIQMAVDYFGDEVDFYVDGGDLSGRPPSTIIGFDSSGGIIVYRQGAVNIEDN
jgi:L-threonylcarbamoyladenylate synthase